MPRPIVASHPTAAVTPERLIELEWTLDRVPEPVWRDAFLQARQPKLPSAWPEADPVVVEDRIRVSVHDDDVEVVCAWVDSSVRETNQGL